ncbi:hypothetical protein Pmar_PMAR002063 [Perkinsus marinus ATCC 50983]|uniref:Uncharacterized protein n=1 Tax=Perkinsus marinus (strain ATCC 50983 / TXsc) TaxID=423536 RepID=C5LYK6_PERM5|nr:hypothetical protein Pmar_PMAR002063 [Perkinsus marinus ATCC 50983]EEQ98244.1 hypothetical protein Pmar_PMAR002063 [Perkinsus marinus ATCC 50983]|eukprot:XP_002765527.1 hypothetical protein Pmar_PMAR002063 [Perkinsus marinus ATCC 50983]
MVNHTIGKSTQSSERRSLRMLVVKEVPDNCLPPNQRRDYCVFILDSYKVNGGTSLAFNKAADLRTIDLEVGALLGSNLTPIDVGVWASGTTTC